MNSWHSRDKVNIIITHRYKNIWEPILNSCMPHLIYPLFPFLHKPQDGTLSTESESESEGGGRKKKILRSMMIQKVINYDWDEKWGFGNYDNNWWKAQISIQSWPKRRNQCLLKELFLMINIRRECNAVTLLSIALFTSISFHPFWLFFSPLFSLSHTQHIHARRDYCSKRMKREFIFQRSFFFEKLFSMLKWLCINYFVNIFLYFLMYDGLEMFLKRGFSTI